MALAGIADKRDAQVSLFSSGWRQRFFIAKGTINKPRVLFMDEPTVGLDVDAALAVRELIADLNRQGCTILLTTHYMREAEELCDRIALISQGRIVAEGTAAELKEQVKQDEAIIIHGRLDPPLRERLGRLPGVLGVAQDEDSVRLLVEHRRAMGPVLETLAEGKVRLESVRFDRPSLEEVFLKLTHQGLEQGDE
jgi:ABC-2 type transport system ATP-binding protein